ncbi:polysaccharide biosynthesis C-terminal domain-containing protein [uncultured Microscilla sp.]|uniref:oligosaccharide flippase family protein n=1 Tax=uncultured Microscilla sp. TaxID=432653 RepID=UPI00261C56C2|nr:polysaccharide biosynthesis C-terminal domain-containing protein [uncultured Microscilla sp.]
MGIVARQGIKSGIILYIGVLIGALNNVWIYPKFLTPKEIGLLRLLLANELVMVTFVQLGTYGIIDRFFPAFKESDQKRGAFIQFSLLYPLLGLTAFLCIHFLFPDFWGAIYAKKSPAIIQYYEVLAILVFLTSYQFILGAFSRAHFRVVVPSMLDNLLLKGGITFLIILFSLQILTFTQFIWGLVVIRFTNVSILVFYLKRLLQKPILWGQRLSKADLKSIIQYGLYMVLGGASSVIISQIDIIMLASLVGEEATGIYSIVFFIGTVVEIPRRALAQISVPVIASAWQNNDLTTIKQIYQKTAINQLIVGALVLGLILLNIRDIFLLMPKGKIYSQGIYVVLFIGLTRFVDMLMGANNEILLYSKYYRFNLITNVILAIIMISINLVLIPLYQLDGAAFATLLSIIIFNLIRFTFLLVKYGIQPFTYQTILALLWISIATGLGYLTLSLQLPPLLNIIVKSAIVSLFFVVGVWKLKLSEDMNIIANNVISLVKGKVSK